VILFARQGASSLAHGRAFLFAFAVMLTALVVAPFDLPAEGRISLEAYRSVSRLLNFEISSNSSNARLKLYRARARASLRLLQAPIDSLCISERTGRFSKRVARVGKRVRRVTFLTQATNAVPMLLRLNVGRLNKSLQRVRQGLCPPVPTSAIRDADTAVNTVTEGQQGVAVGIRVESTDANSEDVVTYRLDDNSALAFSVDPNSGIIKTKVAIYDEDATEVTVTAIATSSDGSSNSRSFAIAVLDDNLVPPSPIAGITDSNSAMNHVIEGAAMGLPVGITLNAVDANRQDSVSYEIVSSNNSALSVNSVTGEVLVAGAIDFETTPEIAFTARATSSDGSSSTDSFKVSVQDISTSLSLDFPSFGGIASTAISARGMASGFDSSLQVSAAGESTGVDGNGNWSISSLNLAANQPSLSVSFQATAHGESSAALVPTFDTRAKLVPSTVAVFGSPEQIMVWDSVSRDFYTYDPESNDYTIFAETIDDDPINPWLTNDMEYDSTSGCLYIVENSRGLICLDVDSKLFSVISNQGVGSGPDIVVVEDGEALTIPVALALDTASGLAYVVVDDTTTIDKVYSVALGNGNRTLINDGSFTGSDARVIRLRNCIDIAFNSITGSLYLSLAISNHIVRISPSSEAGFVLSGRFGTSATVGIGPDLGEPYGLNIDSSDNTLLVGVGDEQTGLMKVDLTTGARTSISTLHVGTGPLLPSIYRIAYSSSGLTYHTGIFNQFLYSVNPVDGERRKLGNRGRGAGDTITVSARLISDLNGNQLYSISNYAIYRLNQITGDRERLAFSPDPFPALNPHSYVGIALDPQRNRLLFTDAATNTLEALDLTSNQVTTISSATLGTGPMFVGTRHIALLPDGNSLIVGSVDNRFYSVDLLTGNRIQILSSVTAAGFRLEGYDHERDLLVCFNSTSRTLALVERETGTVNILADATIGTGPLLDEPINISVDPSGKYILFNSLFQGLIEVDTENLERRSVIDSLSIGLDVGNYKSVSYGENRTAFALNESELVQIDLLTGNRVTLAY
jgi:hypothetical protein